MTDLSLLALAIKNTQEGCKNSPYTEHHFPVEKLDSVTGYICSYCSKEVEKTCQKCNKPQSLCIDFNAYYGSCEDCL